MCKISCKCETLLILLLRCCPVLGNGFFPKECGRCPSRPGGTCIGLQSRIVGGFEAQKGAFPWQVLVEHAEGGNCGGAILNKEWIVTTAHCFYTKKARDDPTKFRITAGEFDRLQPEGSEQRLNGSFIHRHPRFVRDGSNAHDIALIRVNGTFNLSSPHVQPVCFPTAGAKFDDSFLCVVSGWGTFRPGARYNGSSSQFLKYERVPMWNTEKCNSSASHYKGKILKGMLCAGYNMTKRDDPKKCQSVGYGDSGGPLSCRDKKTRQWTVAGVTSWGERCEDLKPTPAVYAEVAYYNSYVKQVFSAHSVATKAGKKKGKKKARFVRLRKAKLADRSQKKATTKKMRYYRTRQRYKANASNETSEALTSENKTEHN